MVYLLKLVTPTYDLVLTYASECWPPTVDNFAKIQQNDFHDTKTPENVSFSSLLEKLVSLKLLSLTLQQVSMDMFAKIRSASHMSSTKL